MALITLDKNSLTLEIKVGILENYKPSKEIKTLYKQVETLKIEANKAIADIVKCKTTEDADSELTKDDKKR